MKKRIFSFLLVLALLLTTFAAFGMDGAAADSARDVQLSEGVRNIVKRAYQMTDIQWTPQADVLGWNGDLTYRAGVTYTGLPYGQPVYAAYVPWVTDLDGFAAAVNDPNSSMYTSYSTYNCRAPYYSCDCSAFVSWAWGLGGRQTTRTIANYATEISTTSYENAQVGDCLCLAGTHVVLITALTYDSNHRINGMEISESTVNAATNYCCQKTWYGDGHAYPLSKVQSKYLDNGYILYRSNTRDSVTYTHACSVPLAGDVCAQCGYGLQLQTVAVTLRTRADTNLYAQPDAAAPIGTMYQGVDIQIGTCARTGSGVWCKTGDGQWLKAADVDFVSYDKTVSVTDKAFPNDELPAGSAFALKGTVRSVNPMTEICAAVYPAQEDSEPVLEKRIVLDRADSYALAGSELDSALPVPDARGWRLPVRAHGHGAGVLSRPGGRGAGDHGGERFPCGRGGSVQPYAHKNRGTSRNLYGRRIANCDVSGLRCSHARDAARQRTYLSERGVHRVRGDGVFAWRPQRGRLGDIGRCSAALAQSDRLGGADSRAEESRGHQW